MYTKIEYPRCDIRIFLNSPIWIFHSNAGINRLFISFHFISSHLILNRLNWKCFYLQGQGMVCFYLSSSICIFQLKIWIRKTLFYGDKFEQNTKMERKIKIKINTSELIDWMQYLNNLDFYLYCIIYNFKSKRHYKLHSVQLKCIKWKWKWSKIYIIDMMGMRVCICISFCDKYLTSWTYSILDDTCLNI